MWTSPLPAIYGQAEGKLTSGWRTHWSGACYPSDCVSNLTDFAGVDRLARTGKQWHWKSTRLHL
eukprot:jgi/Botrbrau1/8056/Bobra.13_2s0025.1